MPSDPRSSSCTTAKAPADASSSETVDRTTMVPDFDVEAFAHDSEMRLAASSSESRGGFSSSTTIDEIRECVEAGDHDGALERAERLLRLMPLHAEARAWAATSKAALEQAILARLGGLTRVPVILVRPMLLRELGLDASEGFVLAQVDGTSDIETLMDLCSMPRLVLLRIVEHLVETGVVGFEG